MSPIGNVRCDYLRLDYRRRNTWIQRRFAHVIQVGVTRQILKLSRRTVQSGTASLVALNEEQYNRYIQLKVRQFNESVSHYYLQRAQESKNSKVLARPRSIPKSVWLGVYQSINQINRCSVVDLCVLRFQNEVVDGRVGSEETSIGSTAQFASLRPSGQFVLHTVQITAWHLIIIIIIS